MFLIGQRCEMCRGPPVTLPKNAGEASIARMDKIRHSKGSIPTADLRRELQDLRVEIH